jgi:hypothetical protein
MFVIMFVVPVKANELTKGINSYSFATVEQLQKVTVGTRLYGYEQVILDTEKANDVNAIFILAVAQTETGFGMAGVGKSRNNAFGLTSSKGGYAYYNNIGESIKAFGSNIKNVHFNNGRYTLGQINSVYCPGNSNWAKSVDNNINSVYNKMIS